MPSTAPHRIIQTRERGTSTDINRIVELSDRNTAIAAINLVQNTETVSGVLNGLRGTVAGSVATISAGLALLNDGVSSFPDSQYRWIEVQEGETLTLDFTAERQTDRWIVIEIAPGVVTTITTPVDVFVPTTGGFVPTTLDKEVQSAPVLTARKGTVSNRFPAGIPGVLPLMYIFDSGASELASADRVLCRPMLYSKSPMIHNDANSTSEEQHLNDQWVQGGGISVAADGTTATAQAMTGVFFNHRTAFKIRHGNTYDLSDGNIWSGGVVPTTETNVFMYCVPVPYPSGYGSVSVREFFMGSNTIEKFATAQASDLGNAFSAQIGCIVVASTVEPNAAQLGIQGQCNANLQVFDAPFQTTDPFVDIDNNESYYMGTMDWASSQAVAQAFTLGSSRVVPETRWPISDVTLIGGVNAQNPVNLRQGDLTLTDSGGLMPVHAFEFYVSMRTDSNTIGEEFLSYKDDHFINGTTSPPMVQGRLSVINATASGSKIYRDSWTMVQKGSQVIMIRTTGLTTHSTATLSYIDSIIAAR